MHLERISFPARYYRFLYGGILGNVSNHLTGGQWSRLLRLSIAGADDWERRWWDHLIRPTSLAGMVLVFSTFCELFNLLFFPWPRLTVSRITVVFVGLTLGAFFQQALAWYIFHHRLSRRLRITANLLRFTSCCIECGYDRGHLPPAANNCPECGAGVKVSTIV